MTERFSLDTNILYYSVDAQSGGRHERAIDIIRAAATADCVIAIQALGEFYHSATRKGVLKRSDAATKIDQLLQLFEIVGPGVDALTAAVAAAKAGRFSIWDGLLLATIERAGCTLLLSEDMANGGRFGAVTVVDPFQGTTVPKRAAEALGL